MSLRVYVSGPMTGYADFNRPAFNAATARLRSMGFEVVNPAELDETDPCPLVDGTPEAHAWYMKRDIAALLDCDAIYLLPGWRWSKGASVEQKVADSIGLTEITDPDPEVWRTFEGEPEDEFHAINRRVEVEIDRNVERLAEDPSADVAPSAGATAPEDGDLSDHPRFGAVFAEIDYIVDDSMPPDTLRIESGPHHLDFTVVPDAERGIRLVPKPAEDYRFADLEAPRPGDEFPNVGYVRRFKALLGLDDAHNQGARRSA